MLNFLEKDTQLFRVYLNVVYVRVKFLQPLTYVSKFDWFYEFLSVQHIKLEKVEGTAMMDRVKT